MTTGPVNLDQPLPFWSVMIPIRNRLTFLRQAVDSVFEQAPALEQMQICIVDNSTVEVDLRSVLSAEQLERIEYYKQPHPLSLPDNWNSCVSRARGKWIHILHDDDYVFPGFYTKLEALIATAPTALAAFTRYDYVSDGVTPTPSELWQTEPGPLENQVERIFSRQIIQCPAICVNADAYATHGGFDSGFPWMLDWEMWMRLASKGLILFEPTQLAAYRLHPTSATTEVTKKAENYHDADRVIRHAYSYIKGTCRPTLLTETLDHYASRAYDDGFSHLWRREYGAAHALFNAAWRLAASTRLRLKILWAKFRLFEQAWRFPASGS